MFISYKYRLYPDAVQESRLFQWINTCRFVYNAGLETKICAWESAGINLATFDLNRQLTALKSIPWIADVPAQALLFEMKNIDKAFKVFYKGGGFPKFRKKSDSGSFSCLVSSKSVDWENSKITIPKIKDIPIKLSRKFDGVIKRVTIRRTQTGKYYISICVESGVKYPTPKKINNKSTIGIDVGIKNFVTTSDGRVFESVRPLKDNIKRLQVLQRRVSKKVKGSKNRRKANKKVALCHEKIANIRNDYIHKVTHALTHDNQVESIVIEDLNVAGMMKNHKLAQALSDVSLYEFSRQLEYKCAWNGINLIKIGRFEPSSKLCSVCSHKNDNLKLSDRIWTCGECGTTHDRDLNAAINIKELGLKKTGVDSSVESVEPLRIRRTKKQKV